MQPRSLPTRHYTSMRCDATNSYIGKSVHLLLRQTTYVCMYVTYVHTFPRAAYPIVVLTSTSNRRCCHGGPIARPPKSPNLKLPDICVRCVQNTLHGKVRMTNCCDFDTSRTGSREESIQIFVVFARVSHVLYAQPI